MTPARRGISEIINNAKCPISAPEILEILEKNKILVNKTTVYRELSRLLLMGKINEVNISSHLVRYEKATLAHHHHLVCKDCGKIEEIVCNELELPIHKFEKRMAKKFVVKEHNLEFFGTCAGCL